MKKIVLVYLFIVIVGGIFHSCQDFLAEEPTDRLVVTNFYETKGDAEAGLFAVYGELHDIYERRIFLSSALPADDMKNGRGMGNSQLQNLEYARHTSESSWVRGMWQRHYRAISKANTVIESVPAIDMDEGDKARIIGEAKFLRALYYFNLVRWHGDIPLVTKVVTTLDEAKCPMSPEADVYALIIEDLEEAEQVLPVSYSDPNSNRATRGAAKILLGKVYLTLHEYQNCVDKLAEVINNEGSYGYGLHEDFKDNWRIATENQLEMVFTVEFMEDPGNGNVEMRLMGPRYAIVDPEGTLGLVKRGDEADIPTVDLWSQYSPEDERREATVTYNIPNVLDGSIHVATIPLILKYWEDGETVNANSDCNMHILRYSDALLMYAEALNEVGQTSNAYQYLNRVRERAFNSTDYNFSGLSEGQFRDAVLQERRLELAIEGHRWFDLVRTGRLIETMKHHSQVEADLAGEPIKLQIGQNIKDYMVRMPIPQVEIDVNPELTQNPGY